MWTLAKLWLKATFWNVKAGLYAAGFLAIASSYAWTFYKGVDYNEAKHRAASAKFQADFNEKQYTDLFTVAAESAAATEAFQKTEAVNDAIEAGLIGPLTPIDACVDAGWLRNLDKLH